MKIECEKHFAQELHEYFSFRVPGFQFVPAYKNKLWNGYIHLFSLRDSTLYCGLIEYVEKFCKERDYTLEVDPKLKITESFSLVEAQKFVDTLNLPFKVRDYQLKSFVHAIRNKKMLLVSPTASGKSLILYLIVSYILQSNYKCGLLIVPTTSLVEQMYKDFESYGFDSEKYCHRQYSGKEKDLGNRKRIFTDSGKSFVLHDNQLIKTLNRGICLVKDLKEEDELPDNFQG